ncbi:DUF1302 family protein [Desulfocicer niacini]
MATKTLFIKFLVKIIIIFSLLVPIECFSFEPIKFGTTDVTAYGWVRNNLGMFLENQPYTQNSNDLATARTWIRLYTDIEFNRNLKFYGAAQLAWEPKYKVEEGTERTWDEYCEYNDLNDVLREASLIWTSSANHKFLIGRQIVIWGEALTERVGDVIHPNDNRFTLGFANLEDTRIPSWMIRGVHNLPGKSSTSLEWLIIPNIEKKEYRVNRLADFPIPGVRAGQRFGIPFEDRDIPGKSIGSLGLNAPVARGGIPPFESGSPELPYLTTEYPESNSDDFRYGFRTSSILNGYQFGVSYFHTQHYDPITERRELTGTFDPQLGLPLREYAVTYPQIDVVGAYLNKDTKVGVLRMEAIYVPEMPFGTFDLDDADAVVDRDYIKYMVAWDLNGYLHFDWHKTASFDITLEHVAEWIPNADDLSYLAFYSTELPSYNPRFAINLSTNWFYDLIGTSVVVQCYPKSKSGLIMPTITYKHPWLNEALTFELKYINVFGEDRYSDIGIMKDKDMVLLTTQFNF